MSVGTWRPWRHAALVRVGAAMVWLIISGQLR